jgi:hypothetical protein
MRSIASLNMPNSVSPARQRSSRQKSTGARADGQFGILRDISERLLSVVATGQAGSYLERLSLGRTHIKYVEPRAIAARLSQTI